jgi:hypothetical protein|tara:strand:+ start:983 stop:1411 length:429 start_codon:yes stop_codon:yes gene_type:complete
MIPTELISMAAGSVTGFIFKFLSQRAKERHENFKMALQKGEFLEKSRNSAVERVPIDAGRWVRRLIVISTLFGVIIAPFFLSLLNEPLYVQVEYETRQWLFGLFGGNPKIQFVRIDGYLMIPEVRQTLTAIVGFYFGSSTVK